MSRIGKLPVVIPAGVKVTVEGNLVTVNGPKGTLTQTVGNNVEIKIENNEILVLRKDDTTASNAGQGLYRALIHNMVVGVTEGFKKSLTINGVGYRVAKQGNKIVMTLGFSHPVEVQEEEGITFSVKDNELTVEGASKEAVGQMCAKIRAIRPVEPYHGYGIRYSTEHVSLKEGKASGKGGKK